MIEGLEVLLIQMFTGELTVLQAACQAIIYSSVYNVISDC
jgi:hypothetical protein